MSITVTSLLWDSPERAGESLERWLHNAQVSPGALANAPPVSARAHPVLDGRISEVLQDAVEFDLGGVLIAAWAGYQALRDAAKSTSAGGPPVNVVLAKHEISQPYQIVVDVTVNGTPVEQLTFDLVLSLLVRDLDARVDGGRLVAVRGGEVAAQARLELNGVELARGGHTFLPGVVVELGDGIELAGGAASPTLASSSGPAWMHGGSTSAPTADATPPWWEKAAANATPTWWQSGGQ